MSRPQPQEQTYTHEEYRQRCAAQSGGRYERVDGHIVAMTPERVGHALVKGNVFFALRQAISAARVPCQVLPDGVTIERVITTKSRTR